MLARTLPNNFMSALQTLLKRDSASSETIPLHLPSSLPPALRSVLCSGTLLDSERRLREAEAFDALEGLRNRLRTKTFMGRFKTANITGQRQGTRARALLSGVDVRIFLLKHRYRRARAALMGLVGVEQWRVQGLSSRVPPERAGALQCEARSPVYHIVIPAESLRCYLAVLPCFFCLLSQGNRRTCLMIWASPNLDACPSFIINELAFSAFLALDLGFLFGLGLWH